MVTGYDGHSYRLQYSDDQGQGAWMSVGVPERGNGALLALPRTNGVAARWTFYPVVVN